MNEPIRCTDGCGATVVDDETAVAQGWQILHITNRYRCPACVQLLDNINKETPNE